MINRFAARRPLWFALILLVVWFFVALGFALLFAALTGAPFIAPLPQSLGALATVACLELLAWRLGWLAPAGLSRLGNWRVWLATLGLIVVVTAAYQAAFFGNVIWNPLRLLGLPNGVATLVRQLVVGTFEETLFRGMLLYVLVRAWGKTRGGLIAAVAIATLLFGLMHVMQVLVGNSLPVVLLVMAESVVASFWWGAMALRGRSVWPVALLHALTNYVLAVRIGVEPEQASVLMSYVTVLLVNAPLALVALWVMLRGRDHTTDVA